MEVVSKNLVSPCAATSQSLGSFGSWRLEMRPSRPSTWVYSLTHGGTNEKPPGESKGAFVLLVSAVDNGGRKLGCDPVVL